MLSSNSTATKHNCRLVCINNLAGTVLIDLQKLLETLSFFLTRLAQDKWVVGKQQMWNCRRSWGDILGGPHWKDWLNICNRVMHLERWPYLRKMIDTSGGKRSGGPFHPNPRTRPSFVAQLPLSKGDCENPGPRLYAKCFCVLQFWNKCWTADRLAQRGLPHPEQCFVCDQENVQHSLTWQFWHNLLAPVGLGTLLQGAIWSKLLEMVEICKLSDW